MLTSIQAFFSRHRTRLTCAIRRFLRRWSWGLLFIPGIISYPFQMEGLVRWTVRHVPNQDLQDSLAAAYAKLVNPLLFYSKLSIAAGMFCFLNLAAWGALNMVMPVLPDWAVGDYRTGKNGYPATPGFKGTFLSLSAEWRMVVYFLAFGLELVAAWGSVAAAFQIQ